MGRLTTLKTRLSGPSARVATLTQSPEATPRIRGRRWMRIRQEALLAGKYQCVDCGCLSLRNEVDHDVPLEQGGSNEQTNLRIRCPTCHAAKTAREAASRGPPGGG
jgi:5-methylcytosine-specific restriction protein A